MINIARLKSVLLTVLLIFLVPSSFALEYELPPKGESVVGYVQYTKARDGETLGDIGRRYDIGHDEMAEANLKINYHEQMPAGTKVIVPSQFVLPAGPRKGIVINLAELRLYYYPPGRNIVITEPVGIGKVGGWQTPVGTTKIVSKVKDPTWYPTENVRQDAASKGMVIPKVFPPGPNNPLGRYAMRLGWHEYLIHSTNRPDGVGRRVSAGCIRMSPEDIERLFPLIKVGTQVRIINEPFKVGWGNGRLYLESHRPLQEELELYVNDVIPMVNNINKAVSGRPVHIKWKIAKKQAEKPSGIPTEIAIR